MLFSSKPKLLFSCFSRKQKTCVSEKNRVFFFHEERCTKKVSVSGKKKHVGFCIRTLHHSLMEREGVAPHFLERGRDFVVYPLSFFFNKKKKKRGGEIWRRFFSLSVSFLERDFVSYLHQISFWKRKEIFFVIHFFLGKGFRFNYLQSKFLFEREGGILFVIHFFFGKGFRLLFPSLLHSFSFFLKEREKDFRDFSNSFSVGMGVMRE